MSTLVTDGDVLSGQAQHHLRRGVRFEGFRLWLVKQRPAPGEFACPVTIGQQSVVADAGEAFWQNVQEQPANEFAACQPHDLDRVPVSIVAPAEADMLTVEIDQAIIGDGCLVGVSPEIGQDLARACERGLGVNHPVPGPQRVCQTSEGVVIGDVIDAQLALLAFCVEELDVLATKDPGEGSCREQEAFPGRADPACPVRAEPAIGHDAVDMDVLPEGLAPGVQDHGDAEFATEPAGSVTEFLQGAGCCLEEQLVDESRLHLREGVELMGEREHHVPVVDIEQIGTLLLDPSGLRERLALGTVPIPARCILDRYRTTLAALALETTECGGPTGHQVAHDPSLSGRERACLAIGVDPCVQDIGHLQCRPFGRHWRACVSPVRRERAGIPAGQVVRWYRPYPALRYAGTASSRRSSGDRDGAE